MDSPEEEIQANMVIGNFNRALGLSEKWLKSFSLSEQNSLDHRKAKEAFLYSRFFIHRQERTAKIPVSGERARTYMRFLREIKELRQDNGYDRDISSFWGSVQFYIHTQIAEGLARDFAGQKSYNLDVDEVMQLATSLCEIENYKAAEEALLFVYQVNMKHALANFLLGIVYFHLNDHRKFQIHMREALFIKPDVLTGYRRFLPPGVYQDLWRHIEERDISELMKNRYYALTLEINGLYPHKRKINADEFRKLEHDFQKLFEEYKSNPNLQDEMQPRILHYLCWLVEYSQRARDFEKFEDYRSLMIDLDIAIWSTFQEKALAAE